MTVQDDHMTTMSTQHPAPSYANKRVLLVEDDRLISLLAVDLLEDRGITVVGPAETLEAALLLSREEDLDAAILDVNLGAETSFAAAAMLRRKGVPFFYTTAFANLSHPEIASEAFLPKPYGAKQLFQMLEHALSRPARPTRQ